MKSWSFLANLFVLLSVCNLGSGCKSISPTMLMDHFDSERVKISMPLPMPSVPERFRQFRNIWVTSYETRTYDGPSEEIPDREREKFIGRKAIPFDERIGAGLERLEMKLAYAELDRTIAEALTEGLFQGQQVDSDSTLHVDCHFPDSMPWFDGTSESRVLMTYRIIDSIDAEVWRETIETTASVPVSEVAVAVHRARRAGIYAINANLAEFTKRIAE